MGPSFSNSKARWQCDVSLAFQAQGLIPQGGILGDWAYVKTLQSGKLGVLLSLRNEGFLGWPTSDKGH